MPPDARAAVAAACVAALLCAGTPARADEPGPLRKPDAVFGQAGIGDHVKSVAIGSLWDWD
jgi:hypothetical protein